MTISHRDALRAHTRAKNAPRTRGKFQTQQTDLPSPAVFELNHVLALREQLTQLLIQTNGETWGTAIVNTLARAMRHTLPGLNTQVEIFQIVLTHTEALAQQHPDNSFLLETVLEPVLTHPAVASGYELQKQNPESEYWAAQALGLGNDYACQFGQSAHQAFLEAHDYLNQSWQVLFELTTAVLQEV